MGEDIKQLLLEKYLARQHELGERISLKDFSDWVGIDDKYLNHIMNGRRRLSPRVAEQFAQYFRDDRFYDLAGIERPDPRLHYVSRHWSEVPLDVKKRISEEVSLYTNDPLPDGETTTPNGR